MSVWDWKQIEKQANLALQKKADDVNASRRSAHAVGMQGNVNQAVNLLQKHIYSFPKDAKAHDVLAAFQIISGQNAEAIASADKALQLDPNFKAARYNRAVALVKTGKREEAIRDLGVAITAVPDFREAALNDPDFKDLAGNSRFKEVTTPPKPEAAK